MRFPKCLLSLALAAFVYSPAQAADPPTSFTYQGTLEQGGSPVTSAVDVRFTLWDDAAAGIQVGTPQTVTVTPTDGVFNASVDFGEAAFETNQALWVQIEVSPQGLGTFDDLGRQAIEGAPYALNTRGILMDSSGDAEIRNVVIGNINAGFGIAKNNFPLNFIGFSNDITNVSGDRQIRFRTNDGERVRLTDTSLNVMNDLIADAQAAIGTLPSGAFPLTLGSETTGELFQFEPDVGLTGSAWELGFNGTGLDLTESGTSEPRVSFNDGGDTELTNTRLNVDLAPVGGSTPDGSRISLTTPGGLPGIIIGRGDGAGAVDRDWVIYHQTDGALHFGDDTANPGDRVLTLTTDKRVGIGDSSPSTKLAVRDVSASENRIAIEAIVQNGTGVRGHSTATTGAHYGVYGQSDSLAGWGVFSSGRLGATGTKSFMIDHPLDPENWVLLHYSSESPEPLNTYSGNIVLGNNGAAVVQLPDYFQSINADYRYHLTAVGAPAPNLHVAQTVQNNRFVIAGGQPGQQISWEVTAKRMDPYVLQRGAPVELQKSGSERGKYLMPELYGHPESRGINFIDHHTPLDR